MKIRVVILTLVLLSAVCLFLNSCGDPSLDGNRISSGEQGEESLSKSSEQASATSSQSESSGQTSTTSSNFQLKYSEDLGVTLEELKVKYGALIPIREDRELGDDGRAIFENQPEGLSFYVGIPSDVWQSNPNAPAICVSVRCKFKDAFPEITAPISIEQFSEMFSLTLEEKTDLDEYSNQYAIFYFNDFDIMVPINSDESIDFDGDYSESIH